jgi:signal peptidase I
MILLAIWGALVLLFLVIRTAVIHYSARAVGIAGAGWRRAAATTLAMLVTDATAIGLLFVVPHAGNELTMLAAVGSLQILCAAILLRLFYAGGTHRNSNWPFLVAAYIATLFVPMVFPLPLRFVAESYVIPTQNMAPTLSGVRLEATCAQCGGPVYFHIADEKELAVERPDEIESGYCLHCDKYYAADALAGERRGPDRFSIEKLSRPRRWSVVAYRTPDERQYVYVGRIVGLPGETIVFRDGFAYAGDQKLEPPAEIAHVRHTATPHSDHPGVRRPRPDEHPLWGDPKKPLKLADDEYFLLGDNTLHSLDCRSFGPVKRSAIIGTAAFIYWPRDRMRVFR